MSKQKARPSPATTTRVAKKSGRQLAARGGAANADLSRRRTWLGVGGAVVAAFVALVVVSATRSTSTNSSGSGTAAVSAPTGSGNVGGSVAPIKLTSIDGKPVSVPAVGRPGVLFFSVSGCTACIPSAQALSTLLRTRVGSRASAVYISMDPQDSPQFMRERRASIGDPPFPFAIDTTGTLVTRYQIQALGTVIIYDARGRIVDRFVEPSLSDLASGFKKAGVA